MSAWKVQTLAAVELNVWTHWETIPAFAAVDTQAVERLAMVIIEEVLWTRVL